jgi:hypothetical protein
VFEFGVMRRTFLLFSFSGFAMVAAGATDAAQDRGTLACILPESLELVIATSDRIESKTAKSGDYFELRLAQPAVLDGKTLVPAGTPGVGQIVHAAPSKGRGQSGELILAARHLEVGAIKVPLRGLRINIAGIQQRSLTIIGTSVAHGVTGTDVAVPAGATAIAKVAAATAIPCAQLIQ